MTVESDRKVTDDTKEVAIQRAVDAANAEQAEIKREIQPLVDTDNLLRKVSQVEI